MNYPLVNVYMIMENHHVSWVNQQTKWASFNSKLWLYQKENNWKTGLHCRDRFSTVKASVSQSGSAPLGALEDPGLHSHFTHLSRSLKSNKILAVTGICRLHTGIHLHGAHSSGLRKVMLGITQDGEVAVMGHSWVKVIDKLKLQEIASLKFEQARINLYDFSRTFLPCRYRPQPLHICQI